MKIQLHRWIGVAVAWLGITSASAYDFKVDGIYYDINADETTVSVTYKTKNSYASSYSGEVAIPQSVTYNKKNYSVTNIGERAFYLCSGLTSITIPESVASIGNQAFSNCTGLTSIIIPESVTSIGYQAFLCCTSLTSIIIPNSVTTIGSEAFSYCFGLTSIAIPKSVANIGDYAFSSCSGLQSIVVAEENTSYSSSEGVLFNKDKTVLIQYPGRKSGAYVIPSGVTTIGNQAFSNCKGLTSITIPNSVTTIGSSAFMGCHGLASVTIPNSVTTIGSQAFHCFDLQSIVVAEGNMSYSSSEGVLFNKDKTVLIQCPRGKSGAYVIPSSVAAIGDYAFDNCTGLTSIIIPESVITIEEGAFYYCTGLTEVTIPNSVKTIGSGAFAYCTGLTSITIPESVITIGFAAFELCTGLTEVTIGESVASIGNYAFKDCTGLETIKSYATIPPAIEANTFSSYNATLYVPVDCGDAYRGAEHWANFTNIVESLDSHVEALQDENARVYMVGNTLHVENNADTYRVYTATGQLVYMGNESAVSLADAGVYIVRTGERSQKVIVR